jgi:hypothetical protein
VLVDGRPVVSPVRATAGMMLEPFDPRIADGDAILHLLSGSLRGATAVPDLARLGGGDASSTQLSGRVDVPHVDLRVAHGVVEGGSQVRATAPSLRAEVATHVVLAALEVDAAVGAGRLTGTVAASRVQVDDDVTVTNLNGRVDAASLDLTAPLTDLHAVIDVDGATLVPSRLPDRPWRGAPFSLERGEVVANGQVEAWRATGTVSGRAKVAAASVSIAVAGARVTGDAVVDASVGSLRPATGEARDVRVKVVAEEVHVAPVGPGMAPWAVAARLVATAESPQVRAAEPFDVWRVEAQALTASVRLPQGRVAGSGRVELLLNGQAASADVDAEVPTVALDVASRRISGALSVNLRARSADWRSGVVALDRADLTGSRLAVSSGGTAPSITAAVLAARLATRALDLAHPFDDLSVTGTLYARRLGLASAGVRAAAEMHAALREVRWRGRRGTLEGDAALLLSTVEAGATGRREPPAFQADALAVTASSGGLDVSQPTLRDVWFHARLSGGEVRDLRSLNNLLRVPESLSFESGSAVASLDLASEGTAAARGTVSVTLRDAGLQLHETHAHGNVALALLAAPGGPDGSWVDLAGSSVSAREVRVTGSSTDTRGWSADLTVPAGVLSLSSAPRIDVDVRLAARDASAILGILLRDSLSRLVASWTVMPSLLAKAHVAADAGGVVVSGIAADGGDVSLHGLYSRAGGEGRGAFVVGKGLFTVGLALDGAGSHLRFFGLDRWLTETSVLAMTPR